MHTYICNCLCTRLRVWIESTTQHYVEMHLYACAYKTAFTEVYRGNESPSVRALAVPDWVLVDELNLSYRLNKETHCLLQIPIVVT